MEMKKELLLVAADRVEETGFLNVAQFMRAVANNEALVRLAVALTVKDALVIANASGVRFSIEAGQVYPIGNPKKKVVHHTEWVQGPLQNSGFATCGGPREATFVLGAVHWYPTGGHCALVSTDIAEVTCKNCLRLPQLRQGARDGPQE